MLASASPLSRRGLHLLQPQRTVQRMRATCGSTAGAAASVAVCWVALALALALCAAPARAQAPEAPREVATCGGCTWLVVGGSPGALVKEGSCEAYCSWPLCQWGSSCLDLSSKGIGLISKGAFLGLQTLVLSYNKIQEIQETAFHALPQLQRLDLSGNGIQAISEGTFLGLPQLQQLPLAFSPLTGLAPATFRNNTVTTHLDVRGTRLGCVAPRCPMQSWLLWQGRRGLHAPPAQHVQGSCG